MLSRREFSKLLSSGFLLTLPGLAEPKSLNFLLEKSPPAKLTRAEKAKLSKAVLDFLQDNYAGMSLQFWQRPYEDIDFQKRIDNIIHWIDIAIGHHQHLYPVDPIWVLSQIKAESLFCELAISNSLAAGICQFLPSTATNAYQMVVAGSMADHRQSPYVKTELAGSLELYRSLVKQRNKYKKQTRSHNHFNLQKALKWLAEGKSGEKQANAQLRRQTEISGYNKRIREARDNYITYMEENISLLGNNDIFGKTEFFTGFDERFTYKKPIFSMVHMLANALRVRNGNVLSAAAAYNAGLRRTWTSEMIYTRYGFIPNIEETSRYVSRIVANYEEIAKRYYA